MHNGILLSYEDNGILSFAIKWIDWEINHKRPTLDDVFLLIDKQLAFKRSTFYLFPWPDGSQCGSCTNSSSLYDSVVIRLESQQPSCWE